MRLARVELYLEWLLPKVSNIDVHDCSSLVLCLVVDALADVEVVHGRLFVR